MLYFWIGLNMALASSFAIPTDSILNSYQQGFIDSVNQKTVKVEPDFHRYNSFTNQHHWTYSNTDSGTEAIQQLNKATQTKLFRTLDHYRVGQSYYGTIVQSYTPNNLVVFPNLGKSPHHNGIALGKYP